jgi:broad specificity phosphatase PhoE
MPLLYLARHAQPDRTRTDLPYHLPPGPPLTGRGVEEAGELGDFFLRSGVRLLIASPLERCLHTARIAAEAAGAQVEIEPALSEWQPGEKAEHIRLRIWPVFEAALQRSQADGPLALVTHGGPVGVLLEALGMDRSALMRQHTYDYGNPLPTGAAWRVERPGEGSPWQLNLAFVPDGRPPEISTGGLPESHLYNKEIHS